MKPQAWQMLPAQGTQLETSLPRGPKSLHLSRPLALPISKDYSFLVENLTDADKEKEEPTV